MYLKFTLLKTWKMYFLSIKESFNRTISTPLLFSLPNLEWNWKTSYLHSSKYSWTFSQWNRADQTFSCFLTNRHHLQTYLKRYFEARVYSYTRRATQKKTHLFFVAEWRKVRRILTFIFSLVILLWVMLERKLSTSIFYFRWSSLNKKCTGTGLRPQRCSL